MANVCTICKHKKRAQIEAALAAGTSLRSIALQFGTTHSTVKRHRECIADLLQTTTHARELGTIATVKEVLGILTAQARFDMTELYNKEGKFDILDLRRRGLGRMIKSISYRDDGTISKIETNGQQSAARALLTAYTQLEITKQMTDAKLLTDAQRAERITALLERAATRERQ